MLPDDPARWPDDPYEVLGVDPSSPRREVRRAYAALIRKYRPDEFPEQFQRIRAAFEIVREWNERSEEEFSHDALPAAMPPDAGEAPSSRDDGLGQETYRKIEEAWKAALCEDPQKAYSTLKALRSDETFIEDVHLRLYWLLKAMPELDSKRIAYDWLIALLFRLGPTPRLLLLFQREITGSPRLILRMKNDWIPTMTSRSSPELIPFLSLRWMALGRIGRSAEIVADLKRLGESRVTEEIDDWVPMMIAALGQLAWHRASESVGKAFRHIRKKLEQISRKYGRFQEELAQVDLLEEVVEQWEKLEAEKKVPTVWRRAIRFFWTQPEEEIAAEMERLLARIADDPRQAFLELETIRRRAPAVLHSLGSYIMRYHSGFEDEHIGRRTDAVAVRLFRFLWPAKKSRVSPGELILDFCMQEEVYPFEVELCGEYAGDLLASRVRHFRIPFFSKFSPLESVATAQYVFIAWKSFWESRTVSG